MNAQFVAIHSPLSALATFATPGPLSGLLSLGTLKLPAGLKTQEVATHSIPEVAL